MNSNSSVESAMSDNGSDQRTAARRKFWTTHLNLHNEATQFHQERNQVQRSLTSKAGHYAVMLLVALDVSCSFADFLITMYVCEHRGRAKEWQMTRDVLGIFSTMFSCLFMVELLASVWAFGFPSVTLEFFSFPHFLLSSTTDISSISRYFKSRFHCFDAAVIVAGFIIDVTLHGISKEVGVLVIVLRFWRVFEIIEELSAASEEQIDILSNQIDELQTERNDLKRERTQLIQQRDSLRQRIPQLHDDQQKGSEQDLL